MKNQTKRIMFIAAVFTLSSQVYAATLPSFANGGFEGYTGITNVHNAAVPPGWTTTGGTPDTFNAGTTFGGYTWASSSTGGDFLHGIGDQPYNESAVQDALTGLTIGDKYEISFEQSISYSNWAKTGGFWEITFGTETQSSDLMTLPTPGGLGGWDWQTMLFTATSETQSLYVKAMSGTTGLRTDIGIDSFYLGTPGGNPDNPDTTPNPVPTPGALLLGSIGVSFAGWFRRRKTL